MSSKRVKILIFNMRNQNKKIIKITLLFGIILLFSAFGCKNADEQTAEDIAAEQAATTDVSFNVPEPTTTTSETSAVDSTTESSQSTSSAAEDVLTPPTTTTTDSTAEEDSTTSNSLATDNDTDDTVSADSVTSAITQDNSPDITSSNGSDDEDVIKLAKVLAEIYGTFTNKDLEPFKNLQDLKTYASEDMQSWIEDKVSSYQASDNTSFYGITTQSLSAAVLDSSATEYKVLVTTEREIVDESQSSPEKNYQLIEMNFVKSSDEWLLDSAYWQ
jgi:hypothetical protein